MLATTLAPGDTAANAATLDVKGTPPLKSLVDQYRSDLELVDRALDGQLPEALLAALRTRDAIARQLESNGSDSAHEMLTLSRLDEALRALAPRIESAIGVSALKQLSSVVASPDRGWWWTLDQYLPRAPFAWTVATALLFTTALSLITEIARRFFAEGPDFTGALYTLVQAALALVAGGTLLGAGGNPLEAVLDAKGIRRRAHPRFKTVLAALVMLLALAGYLLLPFVAKQYNAAGVKRAAEGNLSRAIQDFKRALSLSPDFSQAHYSLGRAYEAVLEYDNAASEYQKAIEIERDLYLAYNSLARLYIVQKEDTSSALGLIDRALDMTADDGRQSTAGVTQARFALLKNRGWANVQSGNYAQARIDLAEAQTLEPQRASVHCLLAQVEEKQGVADSHEWDLCLGYSFGATDVEPVWLATAQDRLAAREVRP